MWSFIDKLMKGSASFDKSASMVCFTFDDAPRSSFLNGGRILEKYGYRGTYYVCAGLAGETLETGEVADSKTFVEFHNLGHEIANHTERHLNCSVVGPVRMALSIWKNRKALKGIMSANFSYPYGAVDARSRCIAGLCTSSARGIGQGINRGAIDIANLKAIRIYNRLGIQKCLDLVADCATNGGWLIFYTHDVCDEPSDYGCTPDQFMEIIQAVSNLNLPVLTVDKAMKRLLGEGRQVTPNSVIW